MITEYLMAAGSWDIQLVQDTPWSIRDTITEWGHIVVLRSELDPRLYTDADLLAEARYVGPVLTIGDQRRRLAGAGMVYHLGDGSGGGDVYEIQKSYTAQSFTTVIADLLPAAVTSGTLSAIAGSYTGTHQYQTPLQAIRFVCDYFGGEFRVNPDGTLDAGATSDLYTTTPTAVLTRKGGTDPNWDGGPVSIEVEKDWSEWTSKVIVFGEGGGSATATATANAAANPYLDIHGNTLVRKRMVTDASTETGNVATRAAFYADMLDDERSSIQVATADFDLHGAYSLGDSVWLFDPDAGITDTANAQDSPFRGERIYPVSMRVVGIDWPITAGYAVLYRAGDGTYTDLTDYVVFEPGDATIHVGSLEPTLVSDLPIQMRDGRFHISVDSAEITDAAITTAKIADLAVTTAKIDNLAVTTAKIGSAAVDSAQIATAAIDTAHIADLQVTNAKIADLAVSKLTAGTITSKAIVVTGAGGYIQSGNFSPGSAGFKLDASDGSAEFQNVTVVGTVTAGAGSNVDWSYISNVSVTNADIVSLAADKITAGTITSQNLTIAGTGVIKSSNYVATSAGWQIEADGDAEFNDVTVRGAIIAGTSSNLGAGYISTGTVSSATITLDTGAGILKSSNFSAGSAGFQIDGTGNAEFNDITVRGTVYATAGEIGGLNVTGNITTTGAGKIRTAASGARTELTTTGLEVYGSGSKVGELNASGSAIQLYVGAADFLYTGTSGALWKSTGAITLSPGGGSGTLILSAAPTQTKAVEPLVTNTYDLGTASLRYATVYATTFNQGGYNVLDTNDSVALLADVATGGAVLNDVMQWNGSAWEDKSLAAAGISATGHTHVEADVTDLSHTPAMDDLSDVTITTVATGELLKWSGTAWINNTLAEAGVAASVHTHTESDITDLSHTPAINDLSDVTITTVGANEVLGYSGGWINRTLAEAGISATGHTHTESDITDLGSYLTLTGGTLTGTLNSRDVIPTTSVTYDLGSATFFWDDLYLDGTIHGAGDIILDPAGGDVFIDGNLRPQGTSGSRAFGTTSENWDRIHADLGGLTSSSTDDVVLHDNSPGRELRIASSFIDQKTALKLFTQADLIDQLVPRSGRWKKEHGGADWVGLTFEETRDVDRRLVGSAAPNTRALIAVTVAAVQDLRRRVEQLEGAANGE